MPFTSLTTPPEAELRIREHIRFLLEHIPRITPRVRVQHVNLLDFVLEYLRQRQLLDKAIVMQQTKGDLFVLRQLATILHPNRTATAFAAVAQPDQHDLVLVSGVGSVYPLEAVLKFLTPVVSVIDESY